MKYMQEYRQSVLEKDLAITLLKICLIQNGGHSESMLKKLSSAMDDPERFINLLKEEKNQ